jgi:predicted nucleic acid-binding protein
VSQRDDGRHGKNTERERSLVFLDTNVILAYLQGDASAAELFEAEADGRICFAVNAIVLQELLLASDVAGWPEFEHIREHLRILPLDFSKAEALLPSLRALRNQIVHSNDVLILSSAEQCDFLVTKDAHLKNVPAFEKPKVLTPEELATQLRAA